MQNDILENADTTQINIFNNNFQFLTSLKNSKSTVESFPFENNEKIIINNNNKYNYKDCKTLEEFFVYSLLNISIYFNKTEVLRIITNYNKKDLMQLFFWKNFNGYNILLCWIKDIKNNIHYIKNYLYEFDQRIFQCNLKLFYKVISIGLYSYDINIIANTNSIIVSIYKQYGVDWDWFISEGCLIYMTNIINFPLLSIDLLETFIELGNFINKEISEIFCDKFRINNKVFLNFVLNIFIIQNNKNKIIIFKKKLICYLKDFYYDNCDMKNIPALLKIYTYFWLYNKEIIYENKEIKNYFVEIFIDNVNNSDKNINWVSGIANLFYLLDKFGKIKDEDGPLIYKTLVYLFLDQFNNPYKKEFFIENFASFFLNNLKFPINLFLTPYFKKIEEESKINICDINFFPILIGHPRFTPINTSEILALLLNISLNNIYYNKSILMIINLCFSSDLLTNNNCDNLILEKTVKILVSYIKKILTNILENIFSTPEIIEENIHELDVCYCIIIKKFCNVNEKIHPLLLEIIETYYKNYNYHSKELLKLLWIFDNYDDFLLQMEEKYFPKPKKNQNQLIFNNNNIKANNCEEIFKETQKITIIKKNNYYKLINDRKKNHEINQKMKEKVESDLKLINNNQKNKLAFIEKENELKLSHDVILKNKLKNILNKNNLNNGILQKIRPYSLCSNKSQKNINLIVNEGDIKEIYPYDKNKSVFSKKLNSLLFYNKYMFCVKLNEEENCEIQGIENLEIKLKTKIKLLCDKLIDNNTISKEAILKLFRLNNMTNKDLSLDELYFCIRNTFPNIQINTFNETQFKKLLVNISYYLMNKINYTYTMYSSYKKILFKLIDNKNPNENKYTKITQYLKKNLNTKTGKINILLPPGFKIIQKTDIIESYKFPKSLDNILNTPKKICYSILNDILLNAINCNIGIMEKYIEIKKSYDIDIDLANIKSWSEDLMIAYCNLPHEFEDVGVIVASILEGCLKNLTKGQKLILKRKEGEIAEDFKNIENTKEKLRKKRYLEIKSIVEAYRSEKEKKNKMKTIEEETEAKKEKDKLIFENHKKFIELQKKLKKSKSKKGKIILTENKNINNTNSNKSNKKKFLPYKRNIKMPPLVKIKKNFSDNSLIQQNKKKIIKTKSDILKIPKISSKNYKFFYEENKDYIDFDKKLVKKLNDSLFNNNLSKNEITINELLLKYDQHLKLIFDIYHKKTPVKPISLYNNNLKEDFLTFNDFKEFLIDFGILNILISKIHMNFIFKRLSKENKTLLNFKNFKLSLLLIVILSKMENDDIKITENNYEVLDRYEIQILLDYLNLKIPFERREIEDMINNRRNMNSKQLKKWKEDKKNNLIDLLKNYHNNYYSSADNSILIKKIKSKTDILLSFSETKIKKVDKKYLYTKKNKSIGKKKLITNINKSANILINTDNNEKILLESAKKEKEENINKEISNKEESKDINSDELSLTYTISTIRDKETGSYDNNDTFLNNNNIQLIKSEQNEKKV